MSDTERDWVVREDAVGPYRYRLIGRSSLVVDSTGVNALETPDRRHAYLPRDRDEALSILSHLPQVKSKLDALQSDLAAARARIAALTTVTEDDVEAAARAICLENIRANGDGTAVDPFGWGEYLTDARAALADFVARKTE